MEEHTVLDVLELYTLFLLVMLIITIAILYVYRRQKNDREIAKNVSEF